MDKRIFGALCVTGWIVLAAGLLAVFGSLTGLTYLSVVLAGLFVMVEYTNRRSITERWLTRINRLAGAVAILYIGYALYRVALLVPGGFLSL